MTHPIGAVPRTPSKTRLVIAGVALAIVVGLSFVVTHDNWVTRADADVVRSIAGDRSTTVAHVAEAITYLGNVIVLAVITLALWLVLRLRRPDVALPYLPALALTAAAIVDPLVKLAVGRPRPPHDLAVVIEKATGYPSGHSAQSAATWIAIALVLGAASAHPRRWLAGGIVVAAVVGASRVVLGVHSPTDVIGGWSLGIACVALLGLALGTRRRPQSQ
ncbi:MAG: phosphatase PAP2 family protein [Solirubrobacteraceae bacterium]|nr:phosphatase PAP2 family protein [Patulibacter sp.]